MTGCWSNCYHTHKVSPLVTIVDVLGGRDVPENHRLVFVEEDFSVVESLAFVVQRVGLILLVCESTDSRGMKTLRRRHHGRKLSQERWRLRRLELPSPCNVLFVHRLRVSPHQSEFRDNFGV